METLLTTVLSSALFLTTVFSAPVTTSSPVVFTRVLPEKDFVGYVVEKDSSMDDIAENAYGSDEYWTTVWNDNSVITDPEAVAKGTVLKVRLQKPNEPEKLADVLAKRNAELTQEKNEEYLKRIGYLAETAQPTVAVQPTVVPTKVPVNTANAASPISEEAITYLGNCEAGMDPAKNTGNGYYGAFQFSYGTWKSMNTGYERADLAPLEVQKAAVKQLLSRSSIYNQFPGCARKMKSAGLI